MQVVPRWHKVARRCVLVSWRYWINDRRDQKYKPGRWGCLGGGFGYRSRGMRSPNKKWWSGGSRTGNGGWGRKRRMSRRIKLENHSHRFWKNRGEGPYIVPTHAFNTGNTTHGHEQIKKPRYFRYTVWLCKFGPCYRRISSPILVYGGPGVYGIPSPLESYVQIAKRR